jgi:hypothetical protein
LPQIKDTISALEKRIVMLVTYSAAINLLTSKYAKLPSHQKAQEKG